MSWVGFLGAKGKQNEAIWAPKRPEKQGKWSKYVKMKRDFGRLCRAQAQHDGRKGMPIKVQGVRSALMSQIPPERIADILELKRFIHSPI